MGRGMKRKGKTKGKKLKGKDLCEKQILFLRPVKS
jgi:hypothetical protein